MSLKNKYNLLYFLFCLVGCCMGGFVAVFLQYKGVSNTQIGVVTGSGCVISIFLAPYLSSLIMKIKSLTIKKMLYMVYTGVALIYLFLAFVKLPTTLIMFIYIIAYAFYVSSGTFLQVLASAYMTSGEEINFGLARGLGSTSWAIGALALGPLCDMFSPLVLVFCFALFTIIMFGLLSTMQEGELQESKNSKGNSVFYIISNYKIFFMLLLGFCFLIAGATCTGTFLINIIKKLGGNTSIYGVAVFLMALSEMPVMALTPRLMRRFDSVTLIVFAAICYTIRNFAICLAPNMFILFIGMAFQGLSYGLLTAVITYYVMYHLKSEDQLMGQTLIGMMTTGIGSTMGNLLGGVLQDTFGISAMYTFIYIMTIIGTVVIVLSKLISLKK